MELFELSGSMVLEVDESGRIEFNQPTDESVFSGKAINPIGETYFSAINGRVFERVASELVYDKNLGTEWYKDENQLLLIIGSDGGLIIPYLEDRAKGSGRLVIIIELPEMIDWIEKHFDFDREFIHLQPADHSLMFLEKSDLYQGYFYRNSLRVCRSMATIDMFHPAYARLWEEYERELNRFFYVKNIELNGSAAFINAQLRNIADNRFSIHHLYNQFSGGFAVLLAGGPSLDDVLEWVKTHRDRLTLFAVGRVAGRLLKEEIYPDFFVSVDPNDISFDNSKELLYFHDKSIFLHAYHVTPRLLSQWRGVSFYHGHHYPWNAIDLDAEQQFLAPGPTVTNTALAFIVQMGFETIIFAGVDLCFKQDGQSHESSSIENEVGRFVHDSTQNVRTNSGQIAPTGPSFLVGHLTLQAQVNGILANRPQVKIVNPAPGAAFIEGVVHTDLESLALPNGFNIGYQQALSIHAALKFKEASFLKSTLTDAQNMFQTLQKTISFAEKGLATAQVLFDKSEKIQSRTKQLLSSKSKLEKLMGCDLPLLMDYAPAKFNDTFLTNTKHKQENSDIQSSFVHYFNAIIASAKLLKNNIEFAVELIRLRQQEMKQSVLTQELVDLWMKYAQPGRLHNWLSRWKRSVDDLNDEELLIATPALRAYDAIFKASETGIIRRFKKTVLDNTLDSVRKAMLLGNEESVFKLDEVLQYCENHADNEFYRDLGLLILGYFSRLRNDTEQAYTLWGMIVHSKLRQDALKNTLLMSMKLQDHERALIALESLCAINKGYLVVYANLLQSLGQLAAAIEVLNAYVHLSPDDMAAKLQLVDLLKLENRFDDASDLLKQAHRQAPNNVLISRMLNEMEEMI